MKRCGEVEVAVNNAISPFSAHFLPLVSMRPFAALTRHVKENDPEF